jgi:hypothetical protein
VPQGIGDQVNHRGQVIADRMICHSEDANPKAGQAGVAQLVKTQPVAMGTTVNLHHQPHLRAIEIDDV